MEYTPPKEKKGKRLSVVFLVIACVGLIGASVLDIRYRVFYQLIAFLVYLFSFELLNRYYLTSFYYTVNEKDFIITKRMGKRTQTVCNLALSTLLGIEKTPKTKEEKEMFSSRFGKALLRYNYCQALQPKSSYTIVFEFNGKNAAIAFEPNEAMVLCIQNKLRSKTESEESMI